NLRWSIPVCRDRVILFVDQFGFIVTREFSYQLVPGIEDFKHDRTSAWLFQVVIYDCSVRRILTGRFLRRQWSVGVDVAFKSIRNLRRKQKSLCTRGSTC